MRMFVVLSPLLTGRKPGDMLTGDQVGKDDAALDRAVAAGYYAEVFFDAPVVDKLDAETFEHPPRNASRDRWVAFADEMGVEVDDDLSRDDIIALFLNDSDE